MKVCPHNYNVASQVGSDWIYGSLFFFITALSSGYEYGFELDKKMMTKAGHRC